MRAKTFKSHGRGRARRALGVAANSRHLECGEGTECPGGASRPPPRFNYATADADTVSTGPNHRPRRPARASMVPTFGRVRYDRNYIYAAALQPRATPYGIGKRPNAGIVAHPARTANVIYSGLPSLPSTGSRLSFRYLQLALIIRARPPRCNPGCGQPRAPARELIPCELPYSLFILTPERCDFSAMILR
jgi:hypothetical protein